MTKGVRLRLEKWQRWEVCYFINDNIFGIFIPFCQQTRVKEIMKALELRVQRGEVEEFWEPSP